MKNRLAAKVLISAAVIFVMVFALGYNLAAQDNGRMDLNSALISLNQVSQATQNDIANMHVESWKSGFLKRGGSHQAEAQQAATSLQRNLRYALPELVHNV